MTSDVNEINVKITITLEMMTKNLTKIILVNNDVAFKNSGTCITHVQSNKNWSSHKLTPLRKLLRHYMSKQELQTLTITERSKQRQKYLDSLIRCGEKKMANDLLQISGTTKKLTEAWMFTYNSFVSYADYYWHTCLMVCTQITWKKHNSCQRSLIYKKNILKLLLLNFYVCFIYCKNIKHYRSNVE